MKKSFLISVVIAMVIVMVRCNDARRDPGRIYAPDMTYSRALETHASTEKLKEKGINYNAMPVPGTVARGDMPAYSLKNDSAGYAQSALVKNPLPPLDSAEMIEGQRLYMVYCGICHGTKLDGNGPLWNNGDGPFPAAPTNLMAAGVLNFPEGTMFHSVTYGKNMMGSYASQLNTKQRWMVIHYIKSKQAELTAEAKN